MFSKEILAILPQADGWRYLPTGEGIHLGEGVTLGRGVSFGDGVVVGDHACLMSNVYIGPHTQIGERSIINSGSYIGEAVYIGDDVHIGQNSTVGGESVIEDKVSIGDNIYLLKNTRFFKGIDILFQPLQILTDEYSAYPCDSEQIAVGCKRGTLAWWEENIEQLARSYKVDAKEYLTYVKLIAAHVQKYHPFGPTKT